MKLEEKVKAYIELGKFLLGSRADSFEAALAGSLIHVLTQATRPLSRIELLRKLGQQKIANLFDISKTLRVMATKDFVEFDHVERGWVALVYFHEGSMYRVEPFPTPEIIKKLLKNNLGAQQ